jgi:uncharacterized protein (DUF488 family)
MLSTIGYEGAQPDDFLKTLKVAGIELVVDVRDRAQSRRPGFSKSVLEQSLSGVGIRYVHYRELGDPKEGREAARAKDIVKFRRIFADVLKTPSAQRAIEQIAETSTHQSACLLCFERDPADCHRTLVAAKIEVLTGERTRHLGVRRVEQVEQHQGRMRHLGEGVAA